MPRKSNTRSAAGAGSIRQRPDGRWEGRITVGTNPATGKPKRRSIYGDTQQEVRKAMTKLISDIDRGLYQNPTKTTVGEWCDEWLDTFCRNRLKPLTVSSYSTTIKNHIKPALGGLKLQDVRGTHIQRFYNDLLDKGLSPKTIRNINAILSKSFQVAVKQALIPFNPCQNAELPKVTRAEIKPLSDEDIPRFLKAIEGDIFENAFALCLFAGLREGEALGLKWDDVDFTNKRLNICRQLQVEKKVNAKYYLIDSTKNGKSRNIQPPDIAFRYIKAEKIKQLENRFAAGQAWSNPDNLVFTTPLGEHLTFVSFWKHFKRIAESIGRPDARPHDLRHTAATVAIASGADIKSVQDLLGHASPAFTLAVYAHTSEKMKEDTANRVQNYYDNLEKQA